MRSRHDRRGMLEAGGHGGERSAENAQRRIVMARRVCDERTLPRRPRTVEGRPIAREAFIGGTHSPPG